MLRIAMLTAAAASVLAIFAPQLAPSLNAAKAPNGVSVSEDQPPPILRASLAEDRAVTIAPDAGGQFTTEVDVDGQSVSMLVDTGATMVVLSHDTAARLGLNFPASAFTARVRTANGVALVAPVTLRGVGVGSIYVPAVKALVADRQAGPVDLLGMSFLTRLSSFEQSGGELRLRQ